MNVVPFAGNEANLFCIIWSLVDESIFRECIFRGNDKSHRITEHRVNDNETLGQSKSQIERRTFWSKMRAHFENLSLKIWIKIDEKLCQTNWNGIN